MDENTLRTHVIYRANGEIVGHTTCATEHAHAIAAREGLHVKQIESSALPSGNQHVQGGTIVDRPLNTAILSGTRLVNLPVPCTITVEGTPHTCNETHADLSFSRPGTYSVKVSAWPMLDATFQVTQP